eukprot:TRINITY_DN3783_c0_g1_i2.p1 TRINITY_DN3783_c0_g1~~TRINITY_DN3783_c0_g1_i2.p1  ORF type:complete len:633 (+),score=112.88 TRINITY_DN3783_c0_g1_i2:113-2011(+)
MDGSIVGHKLFLCANSTMMKAMLNSGMQEENNRTIDLTQWTKAQFEPVFIYLHTGELESYKPWSELDVDPVYKIADYLQISLLRDGVERQLYSKNFGKDITEVIALCTKWIESEDQLLINLATMAVFSNLELKISFELMSFSLVEFFVKSDFYPWWIYSEAEKHVVSNVLDWIKKHPDVDSSLLVKHFRLWHITKEDLLETISKEKAIPAIQLLEALEMKDLNENGAELPKIRTRYSCPSYDNDQGKSFILNVAKEFGQVLNFSCKSDDIGTSKKGLTIEIYPVMLAYQSKVFEEMINTNQIEELENNIFKETQRLFIETLFGNQDTTSVLDDGIEEEEYGVKLYHLAKKHKCHRIIDGMKDEIDSEWSWYWLELLLGVMDWNLNDEIIQYKNWIKLPKYLLVKFLAYEEFDVDELLLFNRLVVWLKANPDCPPDDVLKFVRLGLIPKSELTTTVLASHLIGERLINVLREVSVPTMARLYSKDFHPRRFIPKRILDGNSMVRGLITIPSTKSIVLKGPETTNGSNCGYAFVGGGVTRSLQLCILRGTYENDQRDPLLCKYSQCGTIVMSKSSHIHMFREKKSVKIIVEDFGDSSICERNPPAEEYEPLVITIHLSDVSTSGIRYCYEIRQF